jgi:hypothetical protein
MAFALSEAYQLNRWARALPSCAYNVKELIKTQANRALQGIDPAELGMSYESSSNLHEVSHLV